MGSSAILGSPVCGVVGGGGGAVLVVMFVMGTQIELSSFLSEMLLLFRAAALLSALLCL